MDTIVLKAPSGARTSGESPASPLSRPVAPVGYIPGLDGIRAIAVIAVLLYHGAQPWLPGGFLGVDVFFVLSGFLISTLLFQQLQGDGRIDFRRFYAGRARRLLPALFAMLALTAVLVTTVARDGASLFREHFWPSVFFVANWSFITGEQSYFEAMGRPSLLQHLWSLAVEEQFYLLWPLILLFLFRRRGRAGVGRIALTVALLSTLLMAVLSVLWNVPAAGDASRLYMGTDTHMMSLLIGAALAAVWRPTALPRRLRSGPRLALTAVGVAGVAGVFAAFLWTEQSSNWLYRGGFLWVALATAVMIAVTTHPAALLGPMLAVAPLVWIGRRSYGIYLYHWPIFAVMRPGVDVPWGPTVTFVLGTVLTLAVADVSYRYLEMPIRNGAWRSAVQRWRDEGRLGAITVRALPATLAATAVLVAALMAVPAPDGRDYLGGRTEVGAGPLTATGAGSDTERADEAAAAQQAAEQQAAQAAADQQATADEQAAAAAALAARYGPVAPTDPITMVGDSVTVGASDTLVSMLPGLVPDGAVSRQPGEVFDRIRERRAAGVLANAVVIQTGTNGLIDEDQLRQMLSELEDRRRVVLVTSSGAQGWQQRSNEVVQRVAGDYQNVRVVDWAGFVASRSDVVVEDGVHLSGEGKPAYALLITQALVSP
jgi:peptidoglycan/LPS O-acetylase OafA/YrhL